MNNKKTSVSEYKKLLLLILCGKKIIFCSKEQEKHTEKYRYILEKGKLIKQGMKRADNI